MGKGIVFENVYDTLAYVRRKAHRRNVEIAREIGTTRQNVNRIMHTSNISDLTCGYLEACGYRVAVLPASVDLPEEGAWVCL